MLLVTYYAQNYAGIIGWSLVSISKTVLCCSFTMHVIPVTKHEYRAYCYIKFAFDKI